MFRYKLVLSYDGSIFYGYAKQPNMYTVQSEIERVLNIILNSDIKIFASGRTDKGVHALNQVIHFDTENEILDLTKFLISMNKLIDKAIYIKSIEKVDETFHARFSAKSKTYVYIINFGEYLPMLRNYELNIHDIDINKIIEGSKLFIGKKNFSNFTSKEIDDDNFIREIFDISSDILGNRMYIRFSGDGFMKYEVRKIVGTLLEYAKGKIDLTYIQDRLNVKKNREIVPYQAPARGLYLKEVIY